jgi:hypothetical protein
LFVKEEEVAEKVILNVTNSSAVLPVNSKASNITAELFQIANKEVPQGISSS